MLEAKILLKQGIKKTEIARRLEVDRRTVYNYVNNRVFTPEKNHGRPTGSLKLQPFIGFVKAKLKDDLFFSGELIFNQLIEMGYTGKKTILKDYMKLCRDEIRNVAILRFETLPGVQAQVDWGYLGKFWKDGKLKKRYFFLMKLGYSRRCYLEFTDSMEQSVLLACHKRAFVYFGGIPAEILYDNMKTAFLYDSDMCHWKPHPRLLHFANHYGFTPRRCQIRRPQTKGKVEREIRYVRSSFVPSVHNIQHRSNEELNELLISWLERVDQKVLSEFGQTRLERFAEDFKKLQPIPAGYFDHRQPEPLLVSREGTFNFKTNRYSVDAKYLGKALTGLRDPDTQKMAIFNGKEYIKTVTLSPDGARDKIIDPKDRESLVKAWEKGCKEEQRRANRNAERQKRKAEQENLIQHPSIYDEAFEVTLVQHEEVLV
ncbi:MAG: IS21 family transposase [Planctomycetota bacterium]